MHRSCFTEAWNFEFCSGQVIDLLAFTAHFQLSKFERNAILNS